MTPWKPQKVVVRSKLQKRPAANGKNRTVVHWTVSGKEFSRSFGTSAQAQDMQRELWAAVKRADKFDATTGQPLSWKASPTFLDASLDFIKRKYGNWSPATRSVNIRMLGLVVVAATSPPLRDEFRDVARALFVERCIPGSDSKARGEKQNLAWESLQRSSWHLSEITARSCEALLDQMATKDGWKSTDAAAPGTLARRRTVLAGVLNAAVKEETIPVSPLQMVITNPAKTNHAVEKSEIPTVQQARLLIDEIRTARSHLDTAKRIAVFLSVTLYCGFRPGECSALRPQDIKWPDADSNGWGELTATASITRNTRKWTDDGETVAHGPLKQRAKGMMRVVPAPPVLIKILTDFAAECEPSSDGYLIRTRAGEPITGRLDGPLVRAKERLGWTGTHPLAGVVHYSLRHTCASTMLEAGLGIGEVARRMGHSELELVRTYAHAFHDSTAAQNAKLDSVF